MAKRFTDTDKYKKPFIRALKAPYKILWDYILHDCNHAGIWIVDFDIAQIYVGKDAPVNEFDAIKYFNNDKERVVKINNGKYWFIPDFLEFQYGTEISEKNNIFKSLKKVFDKHDLYKYLTIEIVSEGTTVSSIRNRISKKVRNRVFLENNLTCQYCQDQKDINELVVDHIIPIKKGGTNEDENLTCSCIRCNSHKTDIDPEDFINKNHEFLNPTLKLKASIKNLKGAYNPLTGGKDKDKDKDKDKEEGEKFKIPELSEVVEYFTISKKIPNKFVVIEAENFINHYEDKKWKNSSGDKIEYWRRQASTWVNNFLKYNSNLKEDHRAGAGAYNVVN